MKKTLLTLGLVAFFAVNASAQDNKSKKTTKSTKTEKTEAPAPAVNADGTLAEPGNSANKEVAPATTKKSRMAINQKGTPGSSEKSTEKEKSTVTPK
jgi:hypothetical protein